MVSSLGADHGQIRGFASQRLPQDQDPEEPYSEHHEHREHEDISWPGQDSSGVPDSPQVHQGQNDDHPDCDGHLITSYPGKHRLGVEHTGGNRDGDRQHVVDQ